MSEQKVREVGDNVNSSPLLEAPKWTIDSAWLQGVYIIHMLVVTGITDRDQPIMLIFLHIMLCCSAH